MVDPLAEKFGNFSPYNYGVNNPVLMVDPTGMAAEYNWGTGKYMDNGREVDFADAMASHGMNADGSSMDPPNEYKYNYETGQYDFVSAQGGNQYDILHYDNASFKINNYAGGERIGPGAWLTKIQLASGALVDANWIIDVGVGVGTMSFKMLSNLIARAGSKGVHLVYEGIDAAGNVRYIGITGREATVRFGEHLNAIGTGRELLRYRVINGATGLTETQARIWEQTLINQFGLGKNGGQLLNRIHSIAPKYWSQYGIK